eukprot:9436214-Alexandrium_andersonii.AAC.1
MTLAPLCEAQPCPSTTPRLTCPSTDQLSPHVSSGQQLSLDPALLAPPGLPVDYAIDTFALHGH